jgi:S-adenosylmethionine decarboxylase
MKKNNKVFGYQLLLDLYNCREGVCDDLDFCYDFLEEIVEKIGMEKQSPASIFRSDAKRYPDKAGLSGWIPLIESSVVIHTLSKKNFITIDIYSCKKFDPKKALKYCKKMFGPKRTEQHFITRGQRYFISDSDYHNLTVRDHRTPKEKISLVGK